ncbi:MAG: AsmA family protein [Acidobacteriia bacterium]|nr:AsmA family protein [Terriglobia bacterium]
MIKKRWILLAMVVVVVGAVLAVPFLINVNVYRGVIEGQLNKAINRKVTLNDLRLSLFPVALESKDVHIRDDPSFRKDDFVTIESFRLHLEFRSLLRRQIRVTSLEMIAPVVWLARNSHGEWNFSTLGKAEVTPQSPMAASVGTGLTPVDVNSFNISNLSLKNGRVAILDQARSEEAGSYDVLELTARDISARSAFPFSLTVSDTKGKEPVHLEGEAGPLNLNNMANSPAKGTIEAKTLHAGKIETERMRGQFNLSQGILKLDPLDFDMYSGHESGAMTVNLLQARHSVELNSHLNKIDINQFLSSISSSKNMFFGLLNGDLTLRMSVENGAQALRALVGKAGLELQDGRLAHVSLGQQVALLAKLADVNFPEGETPITKMTGHFEIADNWAQTNDLQIEIPDLSLWCRGGFNFESEMKFDVLATFSPRASQKIQSQNPIGGLLSALLLNQNNQAMVPFQVTGMFQHPHFKLDTQRLLSMKTGKTSGPSNIENTIQSIQDLFKKKK